MKLWLQIEKQLLPVLRPAVGGGGNPLTPLSLASDPQPPLAEPNLKPEDKGGLVKQSASWHSSGRRVEESGT